MKKSIALFCMISTVVLLFNGCSNQDKISENSEVFVMNTYVTQQVYGKNRKQAIENVNNILRETESLVSLFVTDSDIDKINKNAGISPVKVNSYTYNLVKTATDYSKLSNGLFDITIAPLTKLWGITSDHPKVPSQQEINHSLSLIDFRKITFNEKERTIFLEKQEMAIDLGGIAKGYICDLIKQEYEKSKISSALVSIGGNIFAYKLKPNGSTYTLGIRDPYGDSLDIVGTLSATDQIAATTGAYERFFEQDGVIYHHILDTKKGYPVTTDIASVTVISENGGLADFLSTTLFIEGTQHINEYINHQDFDVIIIDKNKNIYLSNRLKDHFTLTNDSYKIIIP